MLIFVSITLSGAVVKFKRSRFSLVKLLFGTVAFQFLGKALAILFGIYIARMVGPEAYGRYSFVLSIIIVAQIPATAGLPQLIIREVSSYRASNKITYIKGFMKWCNCYLAITTAISMTILFVLTKAGVWDENLSKLIVIAVLIIPIRSYLVKSSEILNALKKPILAQLSINILAPILSIIAIWAYSAGKTVDEVSVIVLQAVSLLVSLFVTLFVVKSIINSELGVVSEERFHLKRWGYSLLPFSAVAIVGTLNSEIATIYVGFMESEESVAYLKVAIQATALIAIALQGINAVIAPRITELYRLGSSSDLQGIITNSVRFSVLFSFPFVIVLYLYAEDLVFILFGNEYIPAVPLIKILIIGQVVNICCGSVALILNMTGHEKVTLKIQFLVMLSMFGLLLILVPILGVIGASIALTTTVIAWNVLMSIAVYKITRLQAWIR